MKIKVAPVETPRAPKVEPRVIATRIDSSNKGTYLVSNGDGTVSRRTKS